MKRMYLSLLSLLIFGNLCFASTYNIYNDNTPTKNNKKIYNTFHKKHDNLIMQTDIMDSEAIERIIRITAGDPYVIKVNGVKYYMIKTSKDGVYTMDNIVGLKDNKTSLFDALRKLNSDKDNTKLTAEELKKADIRFVAAGNNGKLLLNNKEKDFNLDNIAYIDLSNLRETVNNGKIGSFGYFDMYIKTPNGQKKIIGYVSFDTESELLEMIN